MFAFNSLLFVPGSRPDRFAKAKASGAGLTVIDLEDAVPSAQKQAARDAALAVEGIGAAGWGIRINPVASGAGIADLAALGAGAALPGHLLLPMVEDARDIEIVRAALGEHCPPLIAMIETPRGLRHALAIAQQQGLAAMMFGGADFAAQLGVAMAWAPLLAARQQLALACAEARLALIDVPYLDLDDAEGLAAECRAARAIGFVAKAAIHPRQVPVIEGAFSPSEADVAEAEAALDAFAKAGGGVIQHKGRMLEAPIIASYRAVLARRTKHNGDT